ncbi:MAG: RecX family transcriptional regulator [Anaerolineae bacterium]|jgi:regulatory protein
MGRQITALRFQKRNKDRVNVYLDGEFAFGLTAAEACRLHVGQALSGPDIVELRMKDEIERAHERALNYLSYRPRSVAEVRRNLQKKDMADEVIDAVITRLTRAGLLDDREFAEYWVKNRTRFNPRGFRGLRHELRQRGVSHVVIEEALETFDVEAAARRTADAGARRLSQAGPREFRRKLQAYMARRGFSYAVVRPMIDEKLEERRREWDIESEERQ